MKIVFFGSDDFAATHLKALLSSSHKVVACVTSPDKPQGRGMKMTVSPIKQIAMGHDIPYLQPLTLKEAPTVEALRAFAADVFVVVAYGRLLTQEVLDIPKVFCVNVHGSLLPSYRGAAPINWAILNGETQTGVTVQKMALKLDAGDIIAQTPMPIGVGESASTLRLRMAQVGADSLVMSLMMIEVGKYTLIAQDESKASWAPKLTKEMGRINWQESAVVIERKVRGLIPWPGAYTSFNGKTLKILEASVSSKEQDSMVPGSVAAVNKQGIVANTAEGQLLITQVHPEAGKAMSAASFAAGHKVKKGDLFC